MRTWATVVWLALAVAACVPAASPTASPGASPTGPSLGTPSPTLGATDAGRPTGLVPLTPPPAEGTPMQTLEQILDEVAARSGVARVRLVVVRDEGVTWPDPGLGCPLPGLAYPQVLVDGHWIVVAADGQEFDYRAGPTGGFRLCTLPEDQRTGPVSAQ